MMGEGFWWHVAECVDMVCSCVELYTFFRKKSFFARRARGEHESRARPGSPRGKFDEASTWHAEGNVLRTVIESLVGEASEF